MRSWMMALGLAWAVTAGAQEPREVRLVYTGGSGGVGPARYAFEVHERLAAAATGAELAAERPLHGVFHQGPHAVWGADDRVDTTVRFLRAGDPSCEVTRRGTALGTPTERVLLPEATPTLAEIPGVTATEVVWHRCEAGGVAAVWVGPPDAPPPTWDVDDFVVRLAVLYSLGADPVYVLGLPRQESGRQVQAIRDQLAALPGAVYVDAGGFVPGASSVAYGAMSLHRPTALRALDALGPAVLVPSASELAPGPRAFLEEARRHELPYIATNWVAEDATLALPPVERLELGGVDVAFLGVVDPAIGEVGRRLGGSGITLSDPVAAVQAQADALARSADPPDLVVLLAFATPALQAALRSELHGIDLHIGDRYAATLRVQSVRTEILPFDPFHEAAPITLPMDGVAVLRARIGDDGLEELVVEPIAVPHDAPADPEVAAAITAVRAEVYPGHDEVLVPSTAEDPLGTVPETTLDRLVCEAVLEATGADAAFLPELADAVTLPGPLTEIQVSDRLALLDVLEVHAVDGDRMRDFLFQVQGEVDTTCGADVGSRFPKVRGRYLDANRTYRVVTTDRARETTDLGAILAAGSADLVLHHPKHRVLTDAEGRPRLLSEVALSALEAWRETAEEGWVAAVVGRSPADKAPLWLLDVDRLSVRTESFQRTERPDAYEQVPETLINSPGSFTLGAETDLGVEYSDAELLWDLRGRASYTRLAIAEQAAQETADDLQLSTSVSLPRLAFPVGGDPSWMPYAEVLFDSELTPVEDDGDALPRQADLSLTVGLSVLKWRWVRELRAGAFVNQDLGHLPGNRLGVSEKGPEYGGRLDLETRHDFFEASSVRVETRWAAQVFGDTRFDDAADLRTRVQGEVRLKLRLVRWLDAALFAEGLLVQGRVPATREPAAAATVGAALDLAAAFRL